MPIEETPFGQEVQALALKLTGEPTVALLAGELTETPDDPPPPLTVMVIGVVEAPPQLSHSSTTVLYFPGFKFKLVFNVAPFDTYTRTPGAV
jgi:hypothetical protein